MTEFAAILFLFAISARADLPCVQLRADFKIGFHGGIGETGHTPEIQAQRKEFMKKSLEESREELFSGMLAIDAVESLLRKMENSGLFNAGKGAVNNERKVVRTDASIMDGRDLSVGAVGDMARVKNPISAAREAMKKGNRLLVGPDGEETVIKGSTLEVVSPSYFLFSNPKQSSNVEPKKQGGTIGVVALDRCGNLAAGTSTGGYDEKPAGRLGDSPIIGAGTYAQNDTCAVSATGQGEKFVRVSAAHEVCAQVRLKKVDVQTASDNVVQKEIKTKLQGVGAIIAMDKSGKFAYSSTHPESGLLRGFITANETQIAVFDKYEVAKLTKK